MFMKQKLVTEINKWSKTLLTNVAGKKHVFSTIIINILSDHCCRFKRTYRTWSVLVTKFLLHKLYKVHNSGKSCRQYSLFYDLLYERTEDVTQLSLSGFLLISHLFTALHKLLRASQQAPEWTESKNSYCLAPHTWYWVGMDRQTYWQMQLYTIPTSWNHIKRCARFITDAQI
jgi:hypothetical protein